MLFRSADAEVPHDGQTLGEICVRGNVVMEGYYDDPKATAEAMRGGWFHSGDAAVVHTDGYVEIRDRFKDVIISGGENISSVEVEATLMRHPAVQEVGVAGVPDPHKGEVAKAWVVLRQGRSATEDEIRSYCRDKLAPYKVPAKVEFRPDLPKTMVGKVLRRALVAESNEQPAGGKQ